MDDRSHPIRLCVLTTSYPRREKDDAGIFVKRLLAALSDAGVTGYIIVPRDLDEPATESLGNFLIERFRYGIFSPGRVCFGAGIVPNLRSHPLRLLQVPALLLRFSEQLLRHRGACDLVIANWISCGYAAWMASLISRTPFVVVVRGEDVRLMRSPVFARLVMPALTAARRLITVSSELEAELSERFPNLTPKITTILNGTAEYAAPPGSRETVRNELGIPEGAKILVSVGTLIPRKRPHLLVDLLAQPGMEEWHLVLIGRTEDEKYLDQLQGTISRLGLQRRTHIIGAVSPEAIPIYLAAADCFATASEFEGRPNAVLEALNMRRPVIATDIAAHRMVLENGASGLLWSEKELQEVPERLKGWLAAFDPARLPRTRTWADCAKEYLHVIRTV